MGSKMFTHLLLLLFSLVKPNTAPISLHVSLIGIMAAPSIDTAFHLRGHLHTYFVFSLKKLNADLNAFDNQSGLLIV